MFCRYSSQQVIRRAKQDHTPDVRVYNPDSLEAESEKGEASYFKSSTSEMCTSFYFARGHGRRGTELG